MKRVLAILLTLVMVLSLIPTTVFAATGSSQTSGSAINGPLSLPVSDGAQSGLLAEDGEVTDAEELTKFEPSSDRFTDKADVTGYKAGDQVTFIVVVDDQSLMDVYSTEEIAAQTAAVQRAEANKQKTLSSVKAQAAKVLGDDCQMGYEYTVTTTGFSVTTDYANRDKLAQLSGVKSVYVAPTFSLPETDYDYTPFTNNATTMIGADILNESGYTGKGMRIAILDTGILVNHPSFAALPDDVLEDPLTEQEVDDIWDSLQASTRTKAINRTYQNTKIPYVFNYDDGSFNVANTYAGSDHGTHVAGIAAANKTDDSKVIGVAPDAQLIVMQVFSPSGGASWDTILAAMEDCVLLKVDSVNLSLGAAAGFTDTPDMLSVMEKFQESDIQLLIASGNDTNNAYGNNWGNNMSLLENPDTGLAGTPSTYSAALGVASVDNDGETQLYITVDGVEYGYKDTASTTYTRFQDNFRNQELEYVMVPGYGLESDYADIDVTGKVAVISRGQSSFPEKQAIAQAHGAIACIIYNNQMGILNMQINDGEGNIPCISVTLNAGKAMASGSGKLKVCNGDTKLFRMDKTVSDFSSWGVTPDLKLKPEIAGVGGSIYSCTDPAISGTYYGYMSGTSMATPQITGAMAVLIEYLDKNYPEITGSEQRQVAADLLMSTADPLMASAELEYSPRAQGAGLANLVSATTSPAFLSNSDASEGRPKLELGDNDSRDGKFSFTFQVNNLTDEALTYTLSSNLITESIYQDTFIAASPYGLETKVVFEDDTVTVPAGGSVNVKGSITLTKNDKDYLEKFPNGIFVEGFIYATPVDGSVTLNMPLVGFYGDWSDADVFDTEDVNNYSLYPVMIYTNYAQLGTNPYIRTGKSGDEYNAFSYSNPLAEIDFGMLRNARKINITVTNTLTGEEYYNVSYDYVTKSYYYSSYGMVYPSYLTSDELWDGLDKNGNELADGTKVTFRMDAYLDDGDQKVDDSIVFDMTLDNEAPEVLNADELQTSVSSEDGRNYLTLKLRDNAYMAAVLFESDNGSIMGKFDVENVPGQEAEYKFDITGFGNSFTLVVADYACNETVLDVNLKLTDNDKPDANALSKDRIYGCETFTAAAVEPGWFSAAIADLSDVRNETYDDTNRYYSAEYMNGYLIAQNANTGALELVTPSGTYWKTQTLKTQSGTVGDNGVWVLYDMALDYSGKYSDYLDPYNSTNGDDSLLAVGWAYKGDNNGDGKDDGYNALFRIWTSKWNGQWFVDEVAQIESPESGAEMLTLGITTEGDMYCIGTDGALYALNLNTGTYDWGEAYVESVTTEFIGTTPFVNTTNYSGVNVIQSMAYDHNTDTMYWFAHSQTLVGYSYVNVNMTYKVNLATGSCIEVGTYGPGGQTAMFIPTDLESDMFTMGVDPNQFDLDSYQVTMVVGQTRKLAVNWTPWNCAPTELTWNTNNPDVATVDEFGYITAVSDGEAEITATAKVYDSWAYNEEKGDWSGAWVDRTVTCTVTVVKSQDSIYGFIVEDFANSGNRYTWVTYSDSNPTAITKLGGQVYADESTLALWQGGAYYNGYIYTVMYNYVEGEGYASILYRSKVTKGETAAQTVIGEPEEIGYTVGLELGNMGFDYNTGRMYAVDLTNGGLAILDLETGAADPLGAFTGDIGGAAIAPAMTVTADGTIVISSMYGYLYTVDADTLYTSQIGYLPDGQYSYYYAAMMYDYNTGNVYWNPCNDSGYSSLYLVNLDGWSWESNVVKLGNVSSKQGVEQTVMFTIPDEEPETHYVAVESLTITNGESVTGLVGGQLQLGTSTTPARPSTQTKVWTSSDDSVVTVDQLGVLTYTGVGTATVTATIEKNTSDGQPISAFIKVTVLESAGKMEAFLAGESQGYYSNWWLDMYDYDLEHVTAETRVNVSLRCGTYFDGYYYAFNNSGNLIRVNVNDVTNYTTIGSCGLDYSTEQVTAIAMDYNTGIMYGLTMPITYSFSSWSRVSQPGKLVTVDLSTGELTTIAELDINQKVFALAIDKDGTLYAAGSNDAYSDAVLYTVDKTTGELTKVMTIAGATVYTGSTYFGTVYYNSQMTYDYGSNRLYLYATCNANNWYQGNSKVSGMYFIQLGEETLAYCDLGNASLYTGSTSYTELYLGLLCMIPEEDEIPQLDALGISLDKTSYRLGVGSSIGMNAKVIPANAPDTTLTYVSTDETIATVSADGVLTGVSEGETTVTITTANGISVVCTVVVVDNSVAATTAYTVTSDGDKLVAFNPMLPEETTTILADFESAGSVGGLIYDAKNDRLIYVNKDSNPYMYSYDFITGQSNFLGHWMFNYSVNDIAYDQENEYLYIVGSSSIYKYDMSKADGSSSDMIWPEDTVSNDSVSDMAAVTVVDGDVYAVGINFSGTTMLVKYDDGNLSSDTCETIARGFAINLSKDATEMDYDANNNVLVLTDGASRIYSIGLDGNNVVCYGNLKDNLTTIGLAIDSTPSYTIRYTDGVEDETIFADQVMYAAAGKATPEFRGTPTRKGYTFTGWDPEVAETVTGHATYTATWAINSYTVSFDARGGEVNGEPITVVYNTAIGTLPVATREGYTFVGWFDLDGNEYTAETVYTLDTDLTLYAKWTANSYTVTLDPNGGSVEAEPITVTFGREIGALPEPTREGYTFLGWFDENGQKIMPDTVYEIAHDSVFTAQWSQYSFTITLDPNGGTVDPTSVQVEKDAPVNTLPTPVREGYTFLGWFDEDGNEYTAETVFTAGKDITLTAAWEVKSFTVTLDDGCGNTDSKTYSYGDALGELPTPTREGYTFVGWADEDGQIVTAETVVTGELNLTAVWQVTPPKTGDSFSFALWGSVMTGALAAMAWMVIRKRKNAR